MEAAFFFKKTHKATIFFYTTHCDTVNINTCVLVQGESIREPNFNTPVNICCAKLETATISSYHLLSMNQCTVHQLLLEVILSELCFLSLRARLQSWNLFHIKQGKQTHIYISFSSMGQNSIVWKIPLSKLYVNPLLFILNLKLSCHLPQCCLCHHEITSTASKHWMNDHWLLLSKMETGFIWAAVL